MNHWGKDGGGRGYVRRMHISPFLHPDRIRILRLCNIPSHTACTEPSLCQALGGIHKAMLRRGTGTHTSSCRIRRLWCVLQVCYRLVTFLYGQLSQSAVTLSAFVLCLRLRPFPESQWSPDISFLSLFSFLSIFISYHLSLWNLLLSLIFYS